MSQLSNKIALVTGGGRGLGRAIALAFADAGADVAVASRTGEQLDEVVREIRGKRSAQEEQEKTAESSNGVFRVLSEVQA